MLSCDCCFVYLFTIKLRSLLSFVLLQGHVNEVTGAFGVVKVFCCLAQVNQVTRFYLCTISSCHLHVFSYVSLSLCLQPGMRYSRCLQHKLKYCLMPHIYRHCYNMLDILHSQIFAPTYFETI